MAAFTMTMSGVYDPGAFAVGYGGPYEGGHAVGDWYNRFGMDLGAAPGTAVHAAFDAVISRANPHNPLKDGPKEYGAQLFMRSANNKMGGFYTHITNVPAKFVKGTPVLRGDYLGTVMPHPPTPHLHFTLVEIVGGLPGGAYTGVDNLYQLFQELSNSDSVDITFMQDGTPPVIELG